MPSRFEAADQKSDFPGWISVAVALVISGQVMMIGLGLNMTEEPPTYGSKVYWAMHGLLIVSSFVTLFLLGRPLFRNLWRSIARRKITIEALFAASLVGAWVVSLNSTFQPRLLHRDIYYDVVSVVLLIYTFGNSLKARAFEEARKILSTARAQMSWAWKKETSGELTRVDVRELQSGDGVVVKPGELVSVDGIIEEGRAFVTMASITGEPSAVSVGPGDKILAGSFSTDGLLTLRMTGLGRSIDAILNTVGGEAPSSYEQLADRVTRWFLPLVGGIAAATFIFWSFSTGLSAGLVNAMSVLLVACPCALGIATPLGVQTFLYALSRYGWRGRSGELVERLASIDTIFFDKTGTLTLSDLKIAHVKWSETSLREDELRGLVALAEKNISQPIARAFDAWTPLAKANIQELRVHPGEGISAKIFYREKEIEISIGQEKFMERLGLKINSFPAIEGKRLIYVAIDKNAMGVISLQESSMPEIETMLQELLGCGINIEVLTGDPHPQIDFGPKIKMHAGLSPEAKALIVEAAQKKNKILFVGDGINDTLAMKKAFCAIAVAEGSPLSHVAATAVVNAEGLGSLPAALAVAKKSKSALSWNLKFSAIYNFLGVALAACGVLNPIVASLLMLTSSLVVSWRALSAVNDGRAQNV